MTFFKSTLTATLLPWTDHALCRHSAGMPRVRESIISFLPQEQVPPMPLPRKTRERASDSGSGRPSVRGTVPWLARGVKRFVGASGDAPPSFWHALGTLGSGIKTEPRSIGCQELVWLFYSTDSRGLVLSSL